jgi:uncharacterized protein
MKHNVYKVVLLALALVIFAAAVFVYRPPRANLTRVTVVGDSQTKVAPDTAVITFSVITQNAQAVNAQQENARKSEAVKKAVEETMQNAESEIKTDEYSLNPEQDYYSGKMPKILGYEVKNSVTVSISDISKVGAVIDAATKAGANSVEGIRFVLGETSPAQGDALALATRQAMAKAEAIAKSLNGKIVRVVESHEGGAPLLASSSANYANAAVLSNSMSAAKYSTPVRAGSLDVRSQVILVVEIEV